MFGTFAYEFEPAKDDDTDLNFTCACGTKVMVGGELGFRSNDAKAQGEKRLCTRCLKNGNVWRRIDA